LGFIFQHHGSHMGYLEVRARWPEETGSRAPRSSQGAALVKQWWIHGDFNGD
jgi:hypothetical protein